MANHFSALKRARQTEKRTLVNRANKSRLRTALRGLREAIAKSDAKAAQSSFGATVSVIDKAVQKGTQIRIDGLPDGFDPTELTVETSQPVAVPWCLP